jgi:hypothetical protein
MESPDRWAPGKLALAQLTCCPRNPESARRNPKSGSAFHRRRPMAGSCRGSRFGEVTRWRIRRVTRKTMGGVGREDIGSVAGWCPPPYRCSPRSRSREARPWPSAGVPAIARRRRSQVSGRDKAVRIVRPPTGILPCSCGSVAHRPWATLRCPAPQWRRCARGRRGVCAKLNRLGRPRGRRMLALQAVDKSQK